jgi:hypothetical protein
MKMVITNWSREFGEPLPLIVERHTTEELGKQQLEFFKLNSTIPFAILRYLNVK